MEEELTLVERLAELIPTNAFVCIRAGDIFGSCVFWAHPVKQAKLRVPLPKGRVFA